MATLLKLCMAPFESDWKMDPSRLQSLNDSSAKWDSVIQFAWNLHAQIRGQVSIRLRMARRHDHRCHDCPAFAETTACWWFFRDCAKNCGRNSRGNFSSSLRCCWHKQMQFSTSFMTVNTFALTWNFRGCLKTLLWIERSCIERKQVFSESHSRMRLYNPDLLWGLCRKMPSRNLLLKSTLLTFLASAGGSYMASPSYAGPVPVYANPRAKEVEGAWNFLFLSQALRLLAESKGDDSPMCFAHGIHRKQLRFEAICVATITPCCL